MPPRLLPIAGKAGATMVCSSAERNIASIMPKTMARMAAWSSGPPGGAESARASAADAAAARKAPPASVSPAPSGAMLWASSGAISLVIVGFESAALTWRARRPNATVLCADQDCNALASLPPLPRRLRQFQRPAHDVVLEILVRHIDLRGADTASYRDAGGMHSFRIAGDQRMPPVEVLALCHSHIGAGRR